MSKSGGARSSWQRSVQQSVLRLKFPTRRPKTRNTWLFADLQTRALHRVRRHFPRNLCGKLVGPTC